MALAALQESVRLTAAALLVALLCVATRTVAWAAPGDLDPTFGNEWVVTTSFGGNGSTARAVVVQSDGKLVTAGSVVLGSHDEFALARYNADGTLDDSFGSGGKVTTAIGTSNADAYALAIQADGKLVAAGSAVDGSGVFALARYNTDGSLDTSFGSGGKVTTAIGTNKDYALALAIQADGKLVAAGSTYLSTPGGPYDVAVVRYNSNGTLDSSFGSGGKVTTSFGSSYDEATALAIQPDGKLVVAGYARMGVFDDRFALARYDSAGNLDPSFGSGGKVTTAVTPVFYQGSIAQALAIQADGKLVAAGSADDGNGGYQLALVRYDSSGSPDGSFGSGGKVTTRIGTSNESVSGLAIQADGKLVASTTSSVGGRSKVALLRCNTDGSLDGSFGTGGAATTELGAAFYVSANSVAIQADGKLVVAGHADSASALVRFTSDGDVDTGYTPGVVTTQVGNSAIWSDMAEQADGKLIAAGIKVATPEWDFLVARFRSDGTLDPTFNNSGAATVNFAATTYQLATSVLVQADQKILAGGGAFVANGNFLLARFESNGTLDSTFGSAGKVSTDFGGSVDSLYATLQQSDGKIVAVGDTNAGGNLAVALARYSATGALDTSFGGTGKVTTTIGAGGSDGANTVVQQPDGKLLIAGHSYNNINYDSDFALVRYNTNGSLDSTFGVSGKVTTDFATFSDFAVSLALLSNGGMVVGGETQDAGNNAYFALAQYTSSGALDASFGSGGKVTGPAGTPQRMVRQRDGKLLMVGGYYDTGTALDYFQAVRFNPNGTLDAGFGSNGVVRVQLGGLAKGMLVQRDGRAVLAGADGYPAAMVRLLTSYCGMQEADLACKASEKSKLTIKRGTSHAKDKLKFAWTNGAATTVGDLMDPTTTSEYSLCIYDDTGLRMQSIVPAAGTCAGAACWASAASGYKYHDKTSAQDGIAKMVLNAGTSGKAKILISGGGEALPDAPASAFTGTVAAEVVNEETGACFVAEYTTAKKNDAVTYSGQK